MNHDAMRGGRVDEDEDEEDEDEDEEGSGFNRVTKRWATRCIER